MSTVSRTIWDLARRLLALEEARHESSATHASGAVRVCERLGVPLARLAGVVGFRSLLSRALSLAKAEDKSLTTAHVGTDGTLEGFDNTEHTQGRDCGVALVAHLLGLLVTFIGEPLTRQLIRGAWPDAAPGEMGEMDETIGQSGAQP